MRQIKYMAVSIESRLTGHKVLGEFAVTESVVRLLNF